MVHGGVTEAPRKPAARVNGEGTMEGTKEGSGIGIEIEIGIGDEASVVSTVPRHRATLDEIHRTSYARVFLTENITRSSSGSAFFRRFPLILHL